MISNLDLSEIKSAQKKQISRGFIFFLLLTEGFITISLEIISIRQLLPFVGSSVIVTSLIIGVFLLFLSFGYYLGGNCNAKHFEKLQFNFSVAACFAGIGLSYAFCQVFFFIGDHFFTEQRLFSLLIPSAPATVRQNYGKTKYFGAVRKYRSWNRKILLNMNLIQPNWSGKKF